MLHYVHQLVSNYVCLLFVTEQVAYSGPYSFFTENSCLLLLETRLMRHMSLLALKPKE